jgi:riboflavin kinase/FMN adenylyltransferase
VQRWHSLDDVPADWGPAVVTIGVFDGVHRGHRHVVGRALEVGAAAGHPTVVVTFDPHPVTVVRPGVQAIALSTLGHRLALLEELGADATLVLHFTPSSPR